MPDLNKLMFEDKAGVSDKELFITARLNGRVRAFLGQQLTDETFEQVKGAIVDEMDRLIAEGVMSKRLDWLAALVERRLYVAYGSRAVRRLSQELRDRGVV